MTTSAAILLLGSLAAILVVLAGWMLIGRRHSPEKLERARRLHLSARGRIADAEILEVDPPSIYYQYSVGGVAYHASQDVSVFRDLFPRDVSLLIGPASVKYSPANPANSILLSEEWSGIRMLARPAAFPNPKRSLNAT